MRVTINLVLAIILVIITTVAMLSTPGGAVVVEEEGFTVSDSPIMEFCGGERAVEQMVHNTPGLIERPDTANLSIRGCNTIDEYLSRYGDGIMESVPDHHQRKLREVYTSLLEHMSVFGDDQQLLFEVFEVDGLVPFLLAIPRPFYVALSEGKQSKNGYAHTVGDTVVLPRNAVRELVNKTDGLRVGACASAVQAPSRRIQTPSFTVWSMTRRNRPTRSSLECKISQILSICLAARGTLATKFPWARNPEHPFEIKAEHVAEHCCQIKSP
jgi:hypothetical protein